MITPIVAAPAHTSSGARHFQLIGLRRGNGVMNSIVSTPSAIVATEHGTVTAASMIVSPASTLMPRHAVIAASTIASKPNETLSRRSGAERNTSSAYDAPIAAIA